MIETISLDANWRCGNGDPDVETAGFDVPSLAAFDLHPANGSRAWLKHRFDLPLQDVCITYTLNIDALPPKTRLSINGHDFGEIVTPFSQDVTEAVFLENNQMILRVSTTGAFGVVRLIAIPCD